LAENKDGRTADPSIVEKLTGRPSDPTPNPYRAADLWDDRALKDEILFTPLDDDERERIERWRAATPLEHGQALYELLRYACGLPNLPRKNDEFPGFPKRLKRL
jgi:hypothetical protein